MSRQVRIATKTMAAINQAIEADNGNSFRYWLGVVLPKMGDAYRQEDSSDRHRSHLGASILGQECAKAIYYSFRWVTVKKFPARILRLFNRGHMEEARVIAMLCTIGITVYQQDENGNQFRISFAGGHGGGSGDGVGLGIPDLPVNTAAILEFKTHGEKSFIELAGKLDEWRKFTEGKGNFTGKGVRDAKFEHWVQMQSYMRKMGLAAALYAAVNKNTDDVYMEIVLLESDPADEFIERGTKLVFMDVAPEGISKSPGFFKCRFCDHRSNCHDLADKNVDRNCRTCIGSVPLPSGEWVCKVHGHFLTKAEQLAACSEYSSRI